MTTFKEISAIKEQGKEFPDKIQAYGYCCPDFKDRFFDKRLQFNINFIDKSMDIIVTHGNTNIFTFTNVKYCGNCGNAIEFIAAKK